MGTAKLTMQAVMYDIWFNIFCTIFKAKSNLLLPVYGYCQVNEEGSTVRTYVNNADLNKKVKYVLFLCVSASFWILSFWVYGKNVIC